MDEPEKQGDNQRFRAAHSPPRFTHQYPIRSTGCQRAQCSHKVDKIRGLHNIATRHTPCKRLGPCPVFDSCQKAGAEMWTGPMTNAKTAPVGLAFTLSGGLPAPGFWCGGARRLSDRAGNRFASSSATPDPDSGATSSASAPPRRVRLRRIRRMDRAPANRKCDRFLSASHHHAAEI